MDKKVLLPRVLRSAGVMLLAIAAGLYFMGTTDVSNIMIWWFTLLVLGIMFQPISLILFRKFHDNGWNFSKVIGLALTAWFVWYITSFKVIKFTAVFCYIAIILLCVLFALICKAYIKKHNISLAEVYSADKIANMVSAEAIFLCFFMAWCYFKGTNPAAYGTERFMDFGFLTTILKSDYMPPRDMWLAGESINYYYVGQYICAFLIRISHVPVGYGYNLAMMMLAAFGFVLPYSIVYNLFRLYISSRSDYKEEENKKNSLPGTAGIIAGLSVSIAGNMHYPIYRFIVPWLNKLQNKEVTNYWFSNATRYIGYNPDVPDKTIHEFPSYSFVLGDLHAHVINIIFVLTIIAVLLAWLIEYKTKLINKDEDDFSLSISMIKEAFSPWLIVAEMLIGLFHMTNYWDFPIYFVVSGAVILFVNLIRYRYKIKAWIVTAIQGVVFLLVGVVVALPFTLSFDSISSGINFCDKHTPFYQLMVLWGLPIAIVVLFIGGTIIAYNVSAKNKQEDSDEKKKGNCITRYLDGLNPAELFALLLGLCAIGLIILPEVIYVIDIYGGAYARANTMFKLVYQAFIMFGIVTAFILIKKNAYENGLMRTLSVVCLFLLFTTYGYIFQCYSDWFKPTFNTLDASAFLAIENEDDKAAIEYINKNVDKDAVVVEMCGLSYSYFNRISVFTGNPTILGWQTHEWLWRSAGEDKSYPKEVSDRHTDIVNIYTSEVVGEVKLLLKKYNVSYIYVGEAEYFDGYSTTGNKGNFHGQSFTKINVNNDLLKSLGEVIMINPSSKTGHEVYLVKVDYNKEISQERIENQAVSVKKYAKCKPVQITRYDSEDNVIGLSTFKYDELGQETMESVYDADNTLVSYSSYEYSGDALSLGVDNDKDGNTIGFWNYIEFDEVNNCTLAHYFGADDKWIKSINTTYFANGAPCFERVNWADGTIEEIVYKLNENKRISEKSYIEDGKSVVVTYTYDGLIIKSAIKTVDGVETEKHVYFY